VAWCVTSKRVGVGGLVGERRSLLARVSVLNQSLSHLGGISASTIGVFACPFARKYFTSGTVLTATVAAFMLGRQSSTITAAGRVTRYFATPMSSCPLPANPKFSTSRERRLPSTAS
jgi:hypothetical protein